MGLNRFTWPVTKGNYALGNKRFEEEIERALKRRVTPGEGRALFYRELSHGISRGSGSSISMNRRGAGARNFPRRTTMP